MWHLYALISAFALKDAFIICKDCKVSSIVAHTGIHLSYGVFITRTMLIM
jgi:hypothetical protein